MVYVVRTINYFAEKLCHLLPWKYYIGNQSLSISRYGCSDKRHFVNKFVVSFGIIPMIYYPEERKKNPLMKRRKKPNLLFIRSENHFSIRRDIPTFPLHKIG